MEIRVGSQETKSIAVDCRAGVSLRGVLCTVFLLPLTGCSENSQIRVSGQVWYDGQSVTEGQIVFRPLDGTKGPTTGVVIVNGRYDLPRKKGPLAGGTYRVGITGRRQSDKTFQIAPGVSAEIREQFIPAQYNRESSLSVKFAENESSQRHDFRLKRVE